MFPLERFASVLFLSLLALPCYPADAIFGRRVYAPEGRTYQQIWTLDTRTRQIAPLTKTPRRHAQPVFASGGARIWFLSGAFGNEANTELWSFDPRSRTEKLAAQFSGRIARLLGGTADRVFFTAYETDELALYRWDGRLTKLARMPGASPDAAALSPDARSLAVQTGDVPEILMMEASGAQGRKTPNCAEPVWSPDGKKLACASGSTIRIVNLATGVEAAHVEFTPRTTPPTVADYSPDGTRLLVKTVGANHSSTYPQSDFWILEIAAGKWTFVGPGQAGLFEANGTVILVTPRELAHIGKRQDWVAQLLLVDPATHAQTPIGAGAAASADPARAPQTPAAVAHPKPAPARPKSAPKTKR